MSKISLKLKNIYALLIIKILLPKEIKSSCKNISIMIYNSKIIELQILKRNKEVKNKQWKKQKPN